MEPARHDTRHNDQDDEAARLGPRTRILVVEDHLKAGKLITAELARHGLDVCLARSARDAKCLVTESSPQLALVTLGLPDQPSFELIRHLSRESLPCIAMSISADRASVLGALRAGASSFVLKDDPIESWLDAISAGRRGGSYLTQAAAAHVAHQLRLSNQGASRVTPLKLTPRETDVAKAFAEGMSHMDCAEHLGLSVATVQDHAKRLYKKLGVRSKAEVATWAVRNRLI